MDAKLNTLFGGGTLPVKLLDGRAAVAAIRQIIIDHYPEALKVAMDEIALVNFCTEIRVETEPGMLEPVAQHATSILTPESYEAVQAGIWQLNEKGFFKYAARQVERGTANLKNLPPEVRQMMEKAISSSLSATLPLNAGFPSPKPGS